MRTLTHHAAAKMVPDVGIMNKKDVFKQVYVNDYVNKEIKTRMRGKDDRSTKEWTELSWLFGS